MSEFDDTDRAEIAEAFGQELDPLAKYEGTFAELEADPVDVFKSEVVAEKADASQATLNAYDRTLRFWQDYMDRTGRHPACPNEDHIKGFVEYLREERENAPGTIRNRLMYLNVMYKYWQNDPAFPHPTSYNPILMARETLDLDDDEEKPMPRLSVAEVRNHVADITHVRNRAVVLLQLKLGLRVTEVCNIKLSEIDVANRDVRAHYEEMGTHPRLEYENAVYIPADRPGNKSEVPRILPLDDEMRAALVRYLLIRPDNGEPWVFLTQTQRGQMQKQDINPVWKDAFHPDYAETEFHRGITSHFGRHFFTNFWRLDYGLELELVKYMRGDKIEEALDDAESLAEYLNPIYEDIEPVYRKHIFKLNL